MNGPHGPELHLTLMASRSHSTKWNNSTLLRISEHRAHSFAVMNGTQETNESQVFMFNGEETGREQRVPKRSSVSIREEVLTVGGQHAAIVCAGQLLTAFLEPRTQLLLEKACALSAAALKFRSTSRFARDREPSASPSSLLFLFSFPRRRTGVASRGPCKPTGRTPCCSKSTAPWLLHTILCGLCA